MYLLLQFNPIFRHPVAEWKNFPLSIYYIPHGKNRKIRDIPANKYFCDNIEKNNEEGTVKAEILVIINCAILFDF